MMLVKVTFHLDGSGLVYNPAEPIHLDALVAWVLAPRQGYRHLTRDEEPADVRLPFHRHEFPDGNWVWKASALFPDGEPPESIWRWRRRLRHARADLTPGRIDTAGGIYRDWDTPIPLVHARKMIAWADITIPRASDGKSRGAISQFKKLLRNIRYLGKKRAHGHGKIVRIDVERTDDNFTLVRDGRAMRWLPMEGGARIVRPRPPYWHRRGAVPCCDVGAPIGVFVGA